MSTSTEPRPQLSPDDALPPVEAPDAGFILQLFVVPAIIVTIIFVVFGMIYWLANMRGSPVEYVQQIRQRNANSWFAAHKLADELRTNPALQEDRQIAGELADILHDSIAEGLMDDESVKLRSYLVEALGKFRVKEVLPALIEAAKTSRDEQELIVRRWAIGSLAGVIDNLGYDEVTQEAELLPTLLAASREENEQIRETAAYALGVLGEEQALSRLVELLGDVYPSVSFNAATGLARHGRTECMETLVSMLDPETVVARSDMLARELLQEAELREQERTQIRDMKRMRSFLTALKASVLLAEKNPSADFTALRKAVESLQQADLSDCFSDSIYSSEIKAEANTAAQKLRGAKSAED